MKTTANTYLHDKGIYIQSEPNSVDDKFLKSSSHYKFLGTVELDIQEPKKLVTREALTIKTVYDFNEKTMLVSGIIPPDALNPRIVYEVNE